MKALALFAVLLYLMFTTGGQAHASPDTDMHDAALFCRSLDRDNSPLSVVTELQKMKDVGYTNAHATDVATYAVTVLCPEHAASIQRAWDFYNPNVRKHLV